jgi:hypothetical protein
VSTQKSDLTTSKILWNGIISTLHVEYMCLDLTNFYLRTPMVEYEYMRLHISNIIDEIVNQYTLKSEVVCMDYHRQANSHTTTSNSD